MKHRARMSRNLVYLTRTIKRQLYLMRTSVLCIVVDWTWLADAEIHLFWTVIMTSMLTFHVCLSTLRSPKQSLCACLARLPPIVKCMPVL